MRYLIAIALVAGCSGPQPDTGVPWVDPCPVLELSHQEVVLDGAGLGEEVEVRLELTNACDGRAWLVVDAAVEGDPSLFIRDSSVTVEPGQVRALLVYFSPEDEEEREAELVLTPHGLDAVRVPLVGRPWVDPADQDRDGHDNPESGGDDCDDTDPDVHPGAPEQDNGVDDDCDGLVDEDFVRPGDVAIDEALIDPEAASDFFGEYVELRNGSGRAWDLTGWELGDSSGAAIVLEGVLEPDKRLLLAAHADPHMNGGLEPDLVYTTDDLSLDNDVGDVLLAVEGRVVSELTWDAEAWGDEWQVGASLSRDPLREGWCFSTSRIPGGDLGTPGLPNDLCDALTDRDGDGFTPAEGDCDDDDPEVNPGRPEVWANWKDDDCDGQADLAAVDDLSRGVVEGSEHTNPWDTYVDKLGWHDQLGAADVDGDGRAELLVGGWSGSAMEGQVWVLEGEEHPTWSGWIGSWEGAALTGETFEPYQDANGYPYPYGPNQLGAIDRAPGDVTGDGVADLVVAGTGDHWLQWDPTRDEAALVVLEGGSGLSGSLFAHDADLKVVLNVSGSRNQVLSSLDVDGDGVAEVVYGEPASLWYDETATLISSAGRASIFLGAEHSGVVEDADADASWEGVSSANLGSTLAGADLDGDGYGDLLVGAHATDKRLKDAGSIYLLAGGVVMDSGSPEDDAFAIIRGASKNDHLGDRPAPRLGDVDGDGKLDLVASSFRHDRVWVFLDVGRLSGKTHGGLADITLESHTAPDHFGVGLAVGDLDGDGWDDVAVGAAGDDTVPAAWATTEGRVYAWRSLDGPTLDAEDAHLTLVGMDLEDGFGMGLLAADLDGDGVDELVVDAPGALAGKGRVYAVSLH